MIDASSHSRILRQKLAELANNNPGLLEALKRRLSLQKAYEDAVKASVEGNE